MVAGELSTQVRRFPASRVEEGAGSNPPEENREHVDHDCHKEVVSTWFWDRLLLDEQGKFWGSRAVNVTEEVVSTSSACKLLVGNCKGASRGRNLVFVHLYFDLPKEVSYLL